MAELTKLVTVHGFEQRHIQQIKEAYPDLEVVNCEDRSKVREYLSGAQALIGGGLNADLLKEFPHVKWLHTYGAGVDSLLFPELVESDVAITNNSGVHAPNIAEHLLGMMLVFTRRFQFCFENQRAHVWARDESAGVELGYQSLAVVGLGDIGHALAVRAKALGMRVVGSRRKSFTPVEGVDEIFPPDRLHEMIAQADHVAITVPSTPRTRGLFGTPEFEVMKNSAIIYNIGRGDIINQDELIDALNSGMIAGAGLDVVTPEPLPADSPLWDTPGVFITPHSSGATPYYWDRGVEIVIKNIERFRNDEPMINLVDKREGY